MADDPETLCDMLGRIEDLADGDGETTVGDVQDRLGSRSFGALILLPALIGVTPVAGIPGLPAVLAVVILLFSVQLAIGRDNLWLPGALRDRGIANDKLRKAMDTLGPWAERLDRIFQRRIRWLTSRPFARVAAAICAAFAATIPVVGFVPFAAALPFAAIAAFGLALLLRDGILMILAALISLGAVWGLTMWAM